MSERAVAAGDRARAHGIASYAIEGSRVRLLGTDGAAAGTLRLSSPTADRREIAIDFADGESWLDLVERPGADGRFVAPVEDSRGAAVATDAGLAAFLATAGVELRYSEHVEGSALTASVAGDCTVSFAGACTRTHCDGFESVGGYTAQNAYARCPAKTAYGDSCAGQERAEVRQRQTCYEAGSCSTVAVGWTGWCCDDDQQSIFSCHGGS